MLLQGFYLRTMNRVTGKESESPLRRCFMIHLRDMTAVITRFRVGQKYHPVTCSLFVACANSLSSA